MYEIVEKRRIAEDVYRIRLTAPHIARKRRAGQFVIVIPREGGERIPLTILTSDAEAGTIDLVFLVAGSSTFELSRLGEGESIPHVAGPLGRPTDIGKVGTVVAIGGGVGTAAACPIAAANAEAGNTLISIIGARTKDLVILEDEFKAFSDRLIVCTDDGSYGAKGFVTEALAELIDSGERIDEVVAVGPLVMMRAVAETTRPHRIKTVVSLNPIMVDGTGMCGGCRVSVGGETFFACVDGPEFDGHQVDFEELAARLGAYVDHERKTMERTRAGHGCKLDEAVESDGGADQLK